MARRPKARTVNELAMIQRALTDLDNAVGRLRLARASQATKYVMAARKSAEGAERHCKAHLAPFEREAAIKAGLY